MLEHFAEENVALARPADFRRALHVGGLAFVREEIGGGVRRFQSIITARGLSVEEFSHRAMAGAGVTVLGSRARYLSIRGASAEGRSSLPKFNLPLTVAV